MTKMYIGNATRQTHEFLYRLPEKTEPFRQHIPPGGQIMIPLDLNPIDIEAVVRQHDRYGMINVDQISGCKRLAPICYALDKPISQARLMELVRKNATVLSVRGEETRREAAVATHSGIERQIFENRMPDNLRELEMTVEEMEAPRDADTGERPEGSTEISEVVHVSRAVAEGAPVRTRPARRRGRE